MIVPSLVVGFTSALSPIAPGEPDGNDHHRNARQLQSPQALPVEQPVDDNGHGRVDERVDRG